MWATSIGSTFAHRPVSGVRKSGIPAGTDTPAPVRATAQRDSWTNAASEPMAPPAAVPPLLTGPFRGPFAEEGGDALLGVLAAEGGREAALLGLDPVVKVAPVGDQLDLLDG